MLGHDHQMDRQMGEVDRWILYPVMFLKSHPLFFKLNGLRDFAIILIFYLLKEQGVLHSFW
jgi:hypothetical protein